MYNNATYSFNFTDFFGSRPVKGYDISQRISLASLGCHFVLWGET
jgi:hypothetical protein